MKNETFYLLKFDLLISSRNNESGSEHQMTLCRKSNLITSSKRFVILNTYKNIENVKKSLFQKTTYSVEKINLKNFLT